MDVDRMIGDLRQRSSNECMLWTDPSLGQCFSNVEMGDLCSALQEHGSVTTLSLSGNTVREGPAEVLARFLATGCRSLRVLDLSFCSLASRSLTAIVKALASNPNLKDVLLNASFNDIKTDGAVGVSEVLEAAPQHSGLRHLVLRYNPLGEGVAALIAKARKLDSLDCSYAGAVDAAAVAGAFGATCCRVVHLCGVDLSGAEAAALQDAARAANCSLVLEEQPLSEEDDPPASHSPTALLASRAEEAAEAEAAAAAAAAVSVSVAVTTTVDVEVEMATPAAADAGARRSEELEDAMWREELALLHAPKGGQAKSPEERRSTSGGGSSAPKSRSTSGAADLSPTASSPPRAASSPLQGAARYLHAPSVSPMKSVSPNPPASENASCSDATLKSMSLALNVLHDSCGSITAERDALKAQLEDEKKLRAAAEKEARQLKRELNQMRDDFAMQVHRLRRESTLGGGGGAGRRDSSPSPQPRKSSSRVASPSGKSYGRVSTLKRSPLTDLSQAQVPPSPSIKRSPSKVKPVKRVPCKSPGAVSNTSNQASTRSPPRARIARKKVTTLR
eukprot:Rhum_TRINITY_DN10339_c0_g1::Rhum_TRINITY_DN10339_c0_g1_i1::g.37839::m.37839